MKYAKACNMKYAHVTADEGAAGKFYQVVWNNPVDFKSVIIHLSDFHGMVELLAIIGKLVSSSGFEVKSKERKGRGCCPTGYSRLSPYKVSRIECADRHGEDLEVSVVTSFTCSCSC